jgi:hypothetical protein
MGAARAARAFVRRGARRHRWLPVALRWRRAMRPVAGPVRAPRPGAAVWQLHMHAHWAIAHASPASMRSTVRVRDVVARYLHRVHSSQTASRHVEVRHARDFVRTVPASPHARVASPTQSTRMFFEQRQTLCATTCRSTLNVVSSTRLRTLHLHARRRPAGGPAPSASQTPMQWGVRAPPLVWRTQAATAQPPTPTSPRAGDAPVLQVESHTRGSSPAPCSETSSARAHAVDAALVERVTDDVIRRIDYRTRLERERRGL